ncbi:phosphatidylinositol N-acetylglucosaminyltransferase subunit C-like [Sycon ciliatum]|uniref:phosphatidylinositol N-acetylglucosaminyltransferase subunit C-like n=1 Tax=Sycon ciliatum TaxID=27933 RepID=UPI0031F6E26F
MEAKSDRLNDDSKDAWSKVLYKRQPFPDNYVHTGKFLEEMRKNVNTKIYTFGQISSAACMVSHQLSSVMVFVIAFCYMSYGWLQPSMLLLLILPLVVIGYVAFRYLDCSNSWEHYRSDMKLSGLVVCYSYGLSPVLMTLTQSVSTDTIYSMTCVMLLAHLLVHDYGTGASAPMVSPAISMNAAVFAGVCLASRLSSSWHTFVTLTCGIALLVFLPLLRQQLADAFCAGHIFLAVPFFIISTILLWTVSAVAVTLFVLLQVTVVLICPYLYCRMQCYKNNIHGPWDEALPDTRAAPQTPDEVLFDHHASSHHSTAHMSKTK